MSRFKERVLAIEEQCRRPERLGELAALGTVIICWCNRCGHHARLHSRQLSLALGPGYPVPEIGARLRCSNCGAKDVATRPERSGAEIAGEGLPPPALN